MSRIPQDGFDLDKIMDINNDRFKAPYTLIVTYSYYTNSYLNNTEGRLLTLMGCEITSDHVHPSSVWP